MIDYTLVKSNDPCQSMRSLYEIVTCLRDPKDGCPWDKEQMPRDMIRSMMGEIYEYIDALNDEDKPHQSEELGDVFLNLFLLGNIHDQNGDFDLSECINDACEKYIRRHPHVFSNVKAENTDEVLANWKRIKVEQEGRSEKKDFFDGISNSAPELDKCYDLSKKAAKVGFDWPNEAQVAEKVKEELAEVLDAQTPEHKMEELGDLLFTVVQMCRKNHIKPSDAMGYANNKFMKRFRVVESLANEQGLELNNLTEKQWDDFWNAAKKTVNN